MKLRLILLLTLTLAGSFGRTAAAERRENPSPTAPPRTAGEAALTEPASGPATPAGAPSAVTPQSAAAPEPVVGTRAAPAGSKGAVPTASTAPAAPARAEAPAAPAIAFDAFRLVAERNIFNPNRTGRRDRVVEDKPARVDQISLVGTMESDRGLRAFFDGSESTYRRAVRVGESVDQFKVIKIAANAVELERDGKNLSVRVGEQLRRPEGADWSLIGEDLVRRDAQARAASEAKVDPSAPPVIPAGASEVEKRMMERRLKNLKN